MPASKAKQALVQRRREEMLARLAAGEDRRALVRSCAGEWGLTVGAVENLLRPLRADARKWARADALAERLRSVRVRMEAGKHAAEIARELAPVWGVRPLTVGRYVRMVQAAEHDRRTARNQPDRPWVNGRNRAGIERVVRRVEAVFRRFAAQHADPGKAVPAGELVDSVAAAWGLCREQAARYVRRAWEAWNRPHLRKARKRAMASRMWRRADERIRACLPRGEVPREVELALLRRKRRQLRAAEKAGRRQAAEARAAHDRIRECDERHARLLSFDSPMPTAEQFEQLFQESIRHGEDKAIVRRHFERLLHEVRSRKILVPRRVRVLDDMRGCVRWSSIWDPPAAGRGGPQAGGDHPDGGRGGSGHRGHRARQTRRTT